MLLELKRAGRFNASRSMIPNARKCGSMASKVYRYAVRIEATDKRLTPDGFVVDNSLIHDYFVRRFGAKAKKWNAISCELMAKAAARELFELITSHGTDCCSVAVEIAGSNGATITAKWGEDDAKLA